MGGDVERGQEELRLHVFVNVVESGDVGGAVAHHEVGVLALEVGDDLLGGGDLGVVNGRVGVMTRVTSWQTGLS